MFTTICSTLALVSSALALTINAPPSDVTVGVPTSITWSSTSSDPVFSVELIHPSFNQALALANNVNPANNNVSITIPPVPAGDGYTIEFVNVTNINDVFATSSDFSITVPASLSSSASAAGVSESATASAAGSVTGSAPQSTATSPSSASASGATSGSPSGTSSSSAGAPSSSSNSALSLHRVPAAATLLLALVAVAFAL
ncbi:hypothetical protein DFH07DRAFT_819019 [Mycena maculata]|uniref:Yeast cell wall synthesis Kre9/Knh1-like N-terminal domain-containing protein n=1 Tax=Mycena maculata TaxID=230809 RepID=A0AAD7JAL2_9AGAR|nr:hypothetical protein DFH07DRAFT_819019 [Mycena maculata]